MTAATTFHELASRLHDSDLFFVQIGAMDGVTADPLREHILASSWHGLLIEPLPDMFERLRENYAGREGLRFERAAIVDRSGPVEMFRVDPQQLARFPSWVGGLSSLHGDRNNLSKPRIRRHAGRVTVPGRTLAEVLAEHAARRIDLLVIDTEGHDQRVLGPLDFERSPPAIIYLEVCNLTRREQMRTRELLGQNGYEVIEERSNWTGVRLDECVYPKSARVAKQHPHVSILRPD